MGEYTGTPLSWLRQKLSSLMRDQSGSVALIFLFAFMLAFGSIALAIDVTRYISLHSKAQEAARVSVRVAAKNRNILNDENLEILARTFAENSVTLSGTAASGLSNFTLEKQNDGRGMTVNLSVQFPVTLMQIFNSFSELEISVSAKALAEIQNTEISFIVDRTDQMVTTGKLEALKDAASSFAGLINTLRKGDNTVRLGVMPMGNQYVNIKPYSEWVLPSEWPTDIPPAVPGEVDWTGSLEEQRWCVDVRPDEGAENDTPPSIEKFPLVFDISKEAGETPESDLYSISTSSDCTDTPFLPLNTDFDKIGLYFSSLNGHGRAAGGRALLWGERMLSPDWQTQWDVGADVPAAYGSGARKVLLFVGGNSFNSSSEEERIFSETCERLKSKGVVMYMVDFNAPTEVGEGLKTCASTTGHYYKAVDENSLNRTFKEIARSLSVLKKVPIN